MFCVCNVFLLCAPLPYLLFPVTPSGRLNGRYAETTPLSQHPSAQCADRELHKTKDKGRQRQISMEQWQCETQSDSFIAVSVTFNSVRPTRI